MLRIDIGERIKDLRQKKGLTVVALEKLSGVSRPNIHRIESGVYNCSVDILEKLLNALNAQLIIK